MHERAHLRDTFIPSIILHKGTSEQNLTLCPGTQYEKSAPMIVVPFLTHGCQYCCLMLSCILMLRDKAYCKELIFIVLWQQMLFFYICYHCCFYCRSVLQTSSDRLAGLTSMNKVSKPAFTFF